MGAVPILKGFTEDDFLLFEEQSAQKHEFYKGEVFAMAGGTVNHNRIVRNCLAGVDAAMQGSDCEVFPSDLKIQVLAANLFTYPDLSVVCAPIDFYKGRTDTIVNPSVLFEVLSPSTEDYDKYRKFEFYKLIPTLKEYILLSSSKIWAQQYRRLSTFEWHYTEYFQEEDLLVIESAGVTLKLKDIYRDVLIDSKA